MLPKSLRLNLAQNFKWVVSGKRIETTSLVIYAKFGNNLNPRIGVSLKKSLFKKAVDRNDVKRRCFQSISPLIQTFPNNLNLIIMPKSNIQSVSVSELEEEVKNGLAGLFNN